jgi:hypothetical protein
MLAGWGIMLLSPPLGQYILCTGFASMFSLGLRNAVAHDK